MKYFVNIEFDVVNPGFRILIKTGVLKIKYTCEGAISWVAYNQIRNLTTNEGRNNKMPTISKLLN